MILVFQTWHLESVALFGSKGIGSYSHFSGGDYYRSFFYARICRKQKGVNYPEHAGFVPACGHTTNRDSLKGAIRKIASGANCIL